MAGEGPALMRATTQLPPGLVHRLEAIRGRRAVGTERTPMAAILRQCIEYGLPLVEAELAPAAKLPAEEEPLR